MNITPERRAEREREHLWAFGTCVVLILVCIGLSLIQPAACRAAGDVIPALCAD